MQGTAIILQIIYRKFCVTKIKLGDLNRGIPKIYNSSNPFDWMELISIQGKTNFFEKRVGEYSNISNPNSVNTDKFDLDEDF